MRTAFKEWAIVVDALGRGDQIVILRKGGIREGKGGFQIEHERFLLFPTLYHQQRESVTTAAQARYDLIAPAFPAADRVRIEYYAEVAAWHKLESWATAERLRGQHIWRDDVVAQRFEWGRNKQVYSMAVRIYRLPQPIECPMIAAYGGCKSWVEMDTDIPTTGTVPVLDDAAFQRMLSLYHAALEPVSA